MLSSVTPQVGIFALGTAAQCYLELDRVPGTSAHDFVRLLASLDEPSASLGGVNVVIGVRPSLWREVAADDVPTTAADFAQPVVGPDGFTMPATQHDGWLWISGASHDIVFDVAWALLAVASGVATVATEVVGWPYHRVRDLTGFVDGTENPPLIDAHDVVVVPNGQAGAGFSVVLFQQWQHRTVQWGSLSDHDQAQVIGRTKPDSIELDDAHKPADSHVARTVIEEPDGTERKIFRRNTPYGGIVVHGTMFVGFCADQSVLQLMLERMAGVGDGIRDALTRYADPLTGAYYVVPSVTALKQLRAQ